MQTVLLLKLLHFTPFGAYAEGKNYGPSPVAIGQTINDLLGTTAMAKIPY